MDTVIVVLALLLGPLVQVDTADAYRSVLVHLHAAEQRPIVLNNTALNIDCLPRGGCGLDAWAAPLQPQWLEAIRRAGVVADYCTSRTCQETAGSNRVPGAAAVTLSTFRKVEDERLELVAYVLTPATGRHATTRYIRYRLARGPAGWFVESAETIGKGHVSG